MKFLKNKKWLILFLALAAPAGSSTLVKSITKTDKGLLVSRLDPSQVILNQALNNLYFDISGLPADSTIDLSILPN